MTIHELLRNKPTLEEMQQKLKEAGYLMTRHEAMYYDYTLPFDFTKVTPAEAISMVSACNRGNRWQEGFFYCTLAYAGGHENANCDKKIEDFDPADVEYTITKKSFSEIVFSRFGIRFVGESGEVMDIENCFDSYEEAKRYVEERGSRILTEE